MEAYTGHAKELARPRRPHVFSLLSKTTALRQRRGVKLWRSHRTHSSTWAQAKKRSDQAQQSAAEEEEFEDAEEYELVTEEELEGTEGEPEALSGEESSRRKNSRLSVHK